MVVSRCCSLVTENWRLKPEALGSIPAGTTFLSFPLPFQSLRIVTVQIISIGLRTWVSPVCQAPCAVMKLRCFHNQEIQIFHRLPKCLNFCFSVFASASINQLTYYTSDCIYVHIVNQFYVAM